jgi:flagellum-specific peptidoglycan hydrolase FlgJ
MRPKSPSRVLDLTHSYQKRLFPGPRRVERHWSSFDWKRFFGWANAFWFLILGLATIGVHQANERAARYRAELESTAAQTTELLQEVERLQELHQYTAGRVLHLARDMQDILLSARGDERDFLRVLIPAALKLQTEARVPASATLAMAIYESGYGRSELAARHNYHGMKAFDPAWDGPTHRTVTRDSGRRVIADFRVFPSQEEGIRGFGAFVRQPRYQAAFTHRDGLTFVSRLLEAGYCPDDDYLDNIRTIIARHHLHLLDLAEIEPVSAEPAAAEAGPAAAAARPQG